MMHLPPRWADNFLKWYCREDILEEIQGDLYELYEREVTNNPKLAKRKFIWNVLRFFRYKNIKKKSNTNYSHSLTMSLLKNNLTVFFRNFKRNPAHSFFSLIGLAIAFTCTFLITLWVKNEYTYDRFNPDIDHLYKVITHVETDQDIQTYFEAGYNLNVNEIPEIEGITHISTGSRWPHELCFTPGDQSKECVYFKGIYASTGLFSMFNFPIISGDSRPMERPAQLAISESMAKNLYGDENPIGKSINLGGDKDVMIASIFKDVPGQSSIQFDFVLPFSILQKQWGIDEERMKGQFLETYIKSSNQSSPALLTEKLNLSTAIGPEAASNGMSYEAIPLKDWHLHDVYENGKVKGGKIEYVRLFVLIACLIMAMAVINFINLSTARASLRAKEIGVRKAIGAVKGHLIFQFLYESFLMVLISSLLGLALSVILLPTFNQVLDSTLSLNSLTGKDLVFGISFLLLISFLSGFYPALVMSSFQSAKIIKGISNFNLTGSLSIRKILMTVQLTLSIGIILFSLVIYNQLDFIRQKNLGFDRENMIRVEPSYRLLKSYDAFKNETLKSGLITDMTVANSNPVAGNSSTMDVEWQGKSPDTQINFQTIGAVDNFPELFGLKVLKGRTFFPEKMIEDSLAIEAVISQRTAEFMGFQDPIGQKIKLFNYYNCEIIGVVNDFHTATLKEQIYPVIIYRQPAERLSGIYIKYQPGKAQESIQAINNSYKELEPDLTLKYNFQDETFDQLYKSEAIATKLIWAFSLVSVVIAFIGILGLATFNSLRKTKEIGVRRVFGANSFDSLLVLIQEFAGVIIASILIALPLSWYISAEWLQTYAFRTEIPWIAFAITSFGSILLIFGIVWVQGQKILLTNPTKSLRSE